MDNRSQPLKVCHITSAHPRYDIRIFIKECSTLASAGYYVNLIVADDLSDEIKSGVNINSVGKPQSRKERMRQTSEKIYRKVLELKPDVVHFHDPELMLIGLKLAKNKFKVVYDVHEDLPKQVMNKHWLPKLIRPLISNIVKQLEKYCSKKFYGVIAATPIIGARFKTYNSNTEVVCNYPILAELNIVNSSWELRQDRLCYIGSISQTRGIIPIVNSLQQSKLPLDLAGPFSGDVDLARLKQLDDGHLVNYLGIIKREQIVELLYKVKVGLVTLLPTPSYIESLPIKMFEYMLAGIPLVASDFPLWRSIISKCGILVNPEDSAAIARACLELINNPEKAKAMGLIGQQAVLREYNWELESQKLIRFYLASTPKY